MVKRDDPDPGEFADSLPSVRSSRRRRYMRYKEGERERLIVSLLERNGHPAQLKKGTYVYNYVYTPRRSKGINDI